MNRLPVLTDLDSLLDRLQKEERELTRAVAELEEEVRRFEDIERPAYEEWVRLSLGPKISAFEEVIQKIQVLRGLIHRIDALMEARKLHPREALYVARHGDEDEEEETPERDKDHSRGSWSADEQEARREASREAKRESRREAKREKKKESFARELEGESLSARLSAVYRKLARKLHPDSPHFLKTLSGSRIQGLWAEVQKAYQARQLERLLSIEAWLGGEADGEVSATPEKVPVSERIKRIRALKKARLQLEKRIQRIKVDPAWGFSLAQGKAREKLRKKAARELDTELLQAQEALAALEDFLDSIGLERPPRQTAQRTEGGRGRRRR